MQKITVKKNEIIDWSMEEDWLQQFNHHLDNYIVNPRRKNKAHKLFAAELKRIVQQIEQAPNKQTNDKEENGNHKAIAIKNQLLPLLRDRSALIKGNQVTLIKRGWNKEKSFLYSLCKFAYQQYFDHEAIKNTLLTLNQHHRHDVFLLEKNLEQKEKQIKTMEQLITKLQEEKKDLKEKFDHDLDDTMKMNNSLRSELLTSNKQKEELLTTQEKMHTENKMQQMQIEQLQSTLRKAAEDNLSQKAMDHTLEEEIKNLRTGKDYFQQKAEQLVTENKELSAKNDLLSEKVTKQEAELTTLQKSFQSLVKFFKDIFGKSFVEKENEAFRLPALSNNEKNQIRDIVNKSTNTFDEKFDLKKKVEESTDKIKQGAGFFATKSKELFEDIKSISPRK